MEYAYGSPTHMDKVIHKPSSSRPSSTASDSGIVYKRKSWKVTRKSSSYAYSLTTTPYHATRVPLAVFD